MLTQICMFMFYFTLAASTSMQTLFKATGSATDTIAVGPGNLKLIYSENEGKLVGYINTRSRVW